MVGARDVDKMSKRKKEYEVETIVDSKVKGTKTEYLVKWKGYPASQNTWETSANLSNVQDMVDAYEEKQNPPPKPAAKRGPGRPSKAESLAKAAAAAAKEVFAPDRASRSSMKNSAPEPKAPAAKKSKAEPANKKEEAPKVGSAARQNYASPAMHTNHHISWLTARSHCRSPLLCAARTSFLRSLCGPCADVLH